MDTFLVNKDELEEAEDGEDGSLDSSREPNKVCEDVKEVDIAKFLVKYKENPHEKAHDTFKLFTHQHTIKAIDRISKNYSLVEETPV